MLHRQRPCGALPSRVAGRQAMAIRAASKGFGTQKAPKSSGVLQTCPCGSKIVYRECCEPIHAKKASASSAEAVLRARFSALAKGKTEYLIATDERADVPEEQRKRDATYACNTFAYSNLKVLQVEAGPSSEGAESAVIQSQYKSKKEPKGTRSTPGYRERYTAQDGTEKPDRNIDGSIKVYTNVEKSTFEKKPDAGWVLTGLEVLTSE